jgi:iron complex outermembrane receptor protein
MQSLLNGVAICALAMAGALTVPACARAADAADAGPATIQEVIVTAERHSESIQSVPLAISAISAAQLADSGVSATDKIQFTVPGLIQTNAQRNLVTFIRSVGTQSGSTGEEPNVSTYVDGVYIGSANGGRFDLNNLERVEVLKGPQGTLFGRNSTGGMIQIITRTPSHEPVLEISAGYGNFDTASASLYASRALTDTLAADIAVIAKDQGQGWGRNITTGEAINFWKGASIRSKWVWTPTRDIQVVLAGDFAKIRTDEGSWRQIYPGATEINGYTFKGGFYDTQADLVTPLPYVEQYGGSLTATGQFGPTTVTNITAYRRYSDGGNNDSDATPLVLQHAFSKAKTDTFQQEVFSHTALDRFDLTVGAIFLALKASYDPLATVSNSTAAANAARFVTMETKSIAGYAQSAYHLREHTRLTLGARYTLDYRDINGHFLALPGFVGIPVGSPTTIQCPIQGAPVNPVTNAAPTTPQQFCAQSKHWTAPTWRVAVDQDLSENAMAYASVSRGFKSGNFNLTNPAALPVDPETLTAYAVGLKATALDKRVRFDGELFYYDYKNIQLSAAQSVTTGTPSTSTFNAAAGTIKGADANIDVYPDVPVGRLKLSAGAEYLHSRYDSFPRDLCINPRTVAPFGNVQVQCNGSGLTMIRAPTLAGTMSADYRIELSSGIALNFHGDVYNTSSYYWQSDDRLKQPAFSLYNAAVSAETANGKWKLTLWGKNLADKKTFLEVKEDGSFGDQYTPREPRTFGVTLGYKM